MNINTNQRHSNIRSRRSNHNHSTPKSDLSIQVPNYNLNNTNMNNVNMYNNNNNNNNSIYDQHQIQQPQQYIPHQQIIYHQPNMGLPIFPNPQALPTAQHYLVYGQPGNLSNSNNYNNHNNNYNNNNNNNNNLPQSPMTPFDVQYGKSMLPKNLLISSPFIQGNNEVFPNQGQPEGQNNNHNKASKKNLNRKLNKLQNGTGSSSNRYHQQHQIHPLRSGLSKVSYDSMHSNEELETDLTDVTEDEEEGFLNSNPNSVIDTDSELELDINLQLSPSPTLKNHPNSSQMNTPLISDDKNFDMEESIIDDYEHETYELSSTSSIDLDDIPDINTRSLTFANLSKNVELKHLLKYIKFGPIENCFLEEGKITKDDGNDNDEESLSTVKEEDESINEEVGNVTESATLPHNESTLNPSSQEEEKEKDTGEVNNGDSSSTNSLITISFVDSSIANKCYKYLMNKTKSLGKALNSPDLSLSPNYKISNNLLPIIKKSIDLQGASRIVFIKFGHLLNSYGSYSKIKNLLYEEFEKFGIIETIRIMSNYNVAFINYTSVSSAIKAVEQLPVSDSVLSECFIFYGEEDAKNNSNSNSTTTNNDTHNNKSIRKNVVNNNNNNNNAQSNVNSRSNSSSVSNNQLEIYSTSSTSFSSPKVAVDQLSNGNHLHSHQIHNKPRMYNNAQPQPQSFYSASRNSSINDLPYFANTMQDPDFYIDYPMYPQPFIYSNQLDSSNSISNPFQFNQINNINNRTLYLGNLSTGVTVEEICNNIRGGSLESIKLLVDKKICFINFLDPRDAVEFYQRSNSNIQGGEPLIIGKKHTKVSWGKNSGPLDPHIEVQVMGLGASRNVYIGIVEDEVADENGNKNDKLKEVPEDAEEGNDVADANDKVSKSIGLKIPDMDTLRRDFSYFGEIEQINYFKDNQCAFVNFLDIRSAISVVDSFNGDNRDEVNHKFNNVYSNFKISFGKDRCGNPPKSRLAKKLKNKRRRERSRIMKYGNPNDQSSTTSSMDQSNKSFNTGNNYDTQSKASAENSTLVNGSTSADASVESAFGITSKTLKKDPVSTASEGAVPEQVVESESESEDDDYDVEIIMPETLSSPSKPVTDDAKKVGVETEKDLSNKAAQNINSNNNNNNNNNNNKTKSSSKKHPMKNFSRSSSTSSTVYRPYYGMEPSYSNDYLLQYVPPNPPHLAYSRHGSFSGPYYHTGTTPPGMSNSESNSNSSSYTNLQKLNYDQLGHYPRNNKSASANNLLANRSRSGSGSVTGSFPEMKKNGGGDKEVNEFNVSFINQDYYTDPQKNQLANSKSKPTSNIHSHSNTKTMRRNSVQKTVMMNGNQSIPSSPAPGPAILVPISLSQPVMDHHPQQQDVYYHYVNFPIQVAAMPPQQMMYPHPGHPSHQ